MRAIFLLDHDNIPIQELGVRVLIAGWAERYSASLPMSVYITIRAYGGWFETTGASQSRFTAADFYQNSCPAVLKHRDTICRVSFTFADKLLVMDGGAHDDAPFVSHTVAKRAVPLYASVREAATTCGEADCELRRTKRWIKKKRACARTGCPHPFETYFERFEQKQVDVHLALDLLAAVQEGSEHVIIATEDWDALPAVLAASECLAAHQQLTVLRFRPAATYLDVALQQRRVELLQIGRT